MKKTFLTSGVIALALFGWLMSGYLTKPATEFTASLAEQNALASKVDFETPPTKVRVQSSSASPRTRFAVIRGKTENKRTVDVKTETTGRIEERLIERGSEVTKGQVLCKIAIEDRRVAVDEALQTLNKAKIDYQGALRLKKQGFNSQSTIAEKKAQLATANAMLKRREIALAKTKVTAPFDGVVENLGLEVGDYAAPGNSCATLVDLDPMLMVGQVSEKMVLDLKVGGTVFGILSNGAKVTGTLTFIGKQGDKATRTYPIEAELDNEKGLLRSGLTTEIQIPTDEVLAHQVSPAIFTLDDYGKIGIRTVNEKNVVEFHHVEILSEDEQGAWVTGLPNQTNIITVGHELVIQGERVDPVLDTSNLPNRSGLATKNSNPSDSKS